MQKEYNFQDQMDYPEDKNPFDFFNSTFDKEEKSEQKNKSYYCTFPGCGKIFRFKSEISRHSVIHLSDRSYPCDHPGCNKAFKRYDALETHIKTHAKIKRFICDYQDCKQKFTSKAGLKYHLLKHRNELPFKCTYPGCQKAFLTAACLDKHQKKATSHSKISHQKKFKDEKFDINFEKCISGSDFEEILKEKPTMEQTTEDSSDFAVQERVESLLESILKENQMMKQQLDGMKRSDQQKPEEISPEIQYKEYSPQRDSSFRFDDLPGESSLLDFLREERFERFEFSHNY